MIIVKTIDKKKVYFQIRGIEHNPPHVHIALSKTALYQKQAINIMVNLLTLEKIDTNTYLGKIENQIMLFLENNVKFAKMMLEIFYELNPHLPKYE